MLRSARPPRIAALAGFAVLASLGLPQAVAQRVAPQAVRPSAASAGPAYLSPTSAPWLRQVLGSPASQPVINAQRITTGNFKSCPKLPTGYKPAKFSCYIVHITGGRLVIGDADQVINRNITITYAQGLDSSGNSAMVYGGLKAQPMPVKGGIYLTPSVNNITMRDPKLQLRVQPRGIGVAPDPTGAGVGYMSMEIKALNPLFGGKCLIGSSAQPLTVDPTFGATNPPPPNKPIHGHIKSVKNSPTETIITGTVVDNAFAAPAAANCGPAQGLGQPHLFDTVVNEVAGLPSPAGTNTAIFHVTVEIVSYKKLQS